MLSFKKSVLEFSFENSLVQIRFPTMKELNDFRKKSKSFEKDEEETSHVIDFVISLGLPQAIADQIEVWMFKEIIDILMKDPNELNKKK
jgi:hypothetical protein